MEKKYPSVREIDWFEEPLVIDGTKFYFGVIDDMIVGTIIDNGKDYYCMALEEAIHFNIIRTEARDAERELIDAKAAVSGKLKAIMRKICYPVKDYD